MYTFLLILYVFTAFLLVGVVLIQQPKSSGGGLFAGTGQSLLGTSGKTFWTKFTTILAALFMLLCLGLTALPHLQGPSSSVADSIVQQQQAAAQAAALPSSTSSQPASSKDAKQGSKKP